MTITSYNDVLAAAATKSGAERFYRIIGTATTSTLYTGQLMAVQMEPGVAPLLVVPSIPSGCTYLAPTTFEYSASVVGVYALCRLVNLGSIDISGASGTFTDGAVMPTRTEGGVSRQVTGPILMVVTSALNATPGTLTVTYTDQDGNTAAAPAITLTASAAVGTAGFLPLNTGDIGAVDITAVTRGAGTTPTGTIRFYGVEMLCVGSPVITFGLDVVNFLTNYVELYQLGAGEELHMVNFGSTPTKAYVGQVNFIGL